MSDQEYRRQQKRNYLPLIELRAEIASTLMSMINRHRPYMTEFDGGGLAESLLNNTEGRILADCFAVMGRERFEAEVSLVAQKIGVLLTPPIGGWRIETVQAEQASNKS